MPEVRRARECLENAAAKLQTACDAIAAAEEELWAGHNKFVCKCGGGEGAYLWVNGDQEAALFREFVERVVGPARGELVAPAARIAAAQSRMILAEVAAVDRSVDPLVRWCALFPKRGGAPPRHRDRVRAMVEAARLRAGDLEEDARQLEAFSAAAGVPPPRREGLSEAIGAAAYLGDKLDLHTSLLV